MRLSYILLLMPLMFLSCKKTNEEPESEFVDTYDRKEIFTNISSQVISSSLIEIESTTQSLLNSISAFELTQNSTTLIALQDAWKDVKISWETYSLFTLGDPQDSYLHSRIDLWPTNNTGIESQVQGAGLVDHALVKVLGANKMGLPALEYLIFMEGDNQAIIDSFTISSSVDNRMGYLNALGVELNNNISELVEEWESYTPVFNSSNQNGYKGSLSEIVNSQVALLEEIIQTKIGAPSGISTGTVNVEFTENFRSEISLDCIKANLKTLEASFNSKSGNSLYGYLDFLQGQKKLSLSISSQLEVCLNQLEELRPTLEVSVVSKPIEVQKFYDELKELLVLIKVDASNRLGVTITFNDNDGD